MQALYKSKDAEVQNLVAQWKDLKSFLASQYTKPISEQSADLKLKEEETKKVEQKLSFKYSEYREFEKSNTIRSSDLTKILKDGEASIEFARFQYYGYEGWTDSFYYVAFILNAKLANPAMVFLAEENQIKSLFTGGNENNLYALRGAKVTNSKQVNYGNELYQVIWQKLEPFLTGIHKVYYAPTGLFHRVAFAAIPIPDENKRLCQKYSLIQMASTKSLAMSESSKSAERAVLLGGIEYDTDAKSFSKNAKPNLKGDVAKSAPTLIANNEKRGSIWSYLPGTEKEIDYLKNALKDSKIKAEIFSKMDASEESIKLMSGNSPGILHIATHGFYLPYEHKKLKDKGYDKTFSLIEDPMFRSGLILAGANLKWKENIDVSGRDDGILTAYEISQLDLSNTELVVLSACETGLGDIQGSEGVYGLQRGFKSAGVKNMIITLWQIPDKESSEFMGMLYTMWLKDKKDLSTAFLETQKHFSTLYPDDAGKWAAFVLVK